MAKSDGGRHGSRSTALRDAAGRSLHHAAVRYQHEGRRLALRTDSSQERLERPEQGSGRATDRTGDPGAVPGSTPGRHLFSPAEAEATADSAKENSLRHDLVVVQDAIELYIARNSGRLPGDNATQADLQAYLRRFPSSPLKNSAVVSVQTTGAAYTGTVTGSPDWRYDNRSGDFIANSNGAFSDGVRRYWEL